jgi:hypothetical protein
MASLPRSGHRAADGANATTDQCANSRIATGRGTDGRTCTGTDQSTRGRTLSWAIATPGQC